MVNFTRTARGLLDKILPLTESLQTRIYDNSIHYTGETFIETTLVTPLGGATTQILCALISELKFY